MESNRIYYIWAIGDLPEYDRHYPFSASCGNYYEITEEEYLLITLSAETYIVVQTPKFCFISATLNYENLLVDILQKLRK